MLGLKQIKKNKNLWFVSLNSVIYSQALAKIPPLDWLSIDSNLPLPLVHPSDIILASFVIQLLILSLLLLSTSLCVARLLSSLLKYLNLSSSYNCDLSRYWISDNQIPTLTTLMHAYIQTRKFISQRQNDYQIDTICFYCIENTIYLQIFSK